MNITQDHSIWHYLVDCSDIDRKSPFFCPPLHRLGDPIEMLSTDLGLENTRLPSRLITIPARVRQTDCCADTRQ